MAAPGHEQLLVVQDLDTKIDQLRHRLTHHPLQVEVDERQAAVAASEAIVEEIAERQRPLAQDLKRLSDEVSLIEDKRAELDAKLYDGSLTATKDLLAVQDEAKVQLERQTTLEDEELELMEQLEPLGLEYEAAVEERTTREAAVVAKQLELDDALVEVAAELADLEPKRDAATGDVPQELRAVYEQLRTDMGGVAVARLISQTCDGCHLSMSAVAFDRIKRLPDDAVVTCGECGRILIR